MREFLDGFYYEVVECGAVRVRFFVLLRGKGVRLLGVRVVLVSFFVTVRWNLF